MRDIFFRGKDVYGNWLYGDLINLTGEIKQICNHTQLEHAHGVNPETVGQYTGLTDKNGKKVFEGDICQIKGISYIDETPFVVEWNEEYSGWFWKNLDFGSATDTITAEIAEMSRVIGNIHDNKDLLEVK